jgi:hypothetical protein
MASSPEQLESELQPVFTGRGFQSMPLLPWRIEPVYFALSWLFFLYYLLLSRFWDNCQEKYINHKPSIWKPGYTEGTEKW